MKLDCYRYEAPDGSGPFYNLDGTSKRGGRNFPPDDIRCGCDFIKSLKTWFKGLHMNPEKDGYRIVHYVVDVPKACYNTTNGHIEFDITKEVVK